jgi:putative ABC transport system permease protein
MKHPLAFLLRVGRSDDERASLLGDLEEERRARLARGSGQLVAFAWYTTEVLRAFAWGLRDSVARRTTAIARRTSHDAPRTSHAARRTSFFCWPDIKLSLRLLIRHPGLTAVSTVGIAVGIAIAAGMFGFFHANFDPTLPLDEGDRIVALENWDIVNNNENRHSLHDFVTWRDQMTSVVEISAFREARATMRSGDFLPETVRIAAMSASGFRVARVPALVGRFLTPDDEREAAPPVVVIGYTVWQSRFEQDRSVIGQQVRFGNTQYTIVGVMPEGFAFPVNHQYWIPLRVNPSIPRGAGPELFVFGRLAPGATMASAQAELSAIGQRAAAAFPQTNAMLKPQALGYTKPIIDNQDMGLDAWVMGQLTVSLVLVVVALNVAILLYARTATRRGEIAVRTALGASRGRIVTQLFVEALVLAVVPAVLGLVLAQYGLDLGNRLMFLDLVGGAAPFWLEHGPQPSTMLYVLVLVVVTAAIAGILPALHATRRRGGTDLRQLGGSTGLRLGRMWSALIVVQVAFAVAVLPAAIKMGIKEIRTSLTRPNYPVEEFVGAAVATENGSSPFGNRLLEVRRRLQAEPDVTGVTFTGSLPQRAITGRIEVEDIPVEGAAAANGSRGLTTFGIDTDYLDVYGLRVVAGRPFNALDASASDGTVIVDRSFAQRFLNGMSAVGRRIRYAARPNGQPSPWYEIVGVAENLRRNPIDPAVVGPTVLYPVAHEQLTGVSLTVRLRGSAASRMNAGFARKAHQILAAVDPALRMGEVQTHAQADTEDALAVRLVALALSCILVTVLLFSAAGVYSLMSFTVAQRRREIGIRAALGASPMGLLRSIFSRVAAQVGTGVILGALGAMVIAPLSDDVVLAERLAMVTPAIALIMVLVGVVAAYGPARRSLRIQPTEAVRAE